MTTKYFCVSSSRRLTAKRTLVVGAAVGVVCFILHNFVLTSHNKIPQELCTQSEFELVHDSSQNTSALVKVFDLPTYILSVIIPTDQFHSQTPVVVVNVFDSSDVSLNCCILQSDSTLHVTRSSILRQFHPQLYIHALVELFYHAQYPARQIICPLMSSPESATHISLSPSTCSSDSQQYKQIVHAADHTGELAVCAKVAYNDNLEPRRLVEWFEFQKLLGVDKVLLFTLDVTARVKKVLDFYVRQGLLITVQYELAGEPKRGFAPQDRVFPQFYHDEELAIFDCRERLSGYSHVAGIDLDELVIPRNGQSLKDLLQTTLPHKYPDAGAYYFYQQFHITDWSPSHPDNSLITLRFLNSDPPRWECQKFVYIPHNTLYGRTHEVFVKSGYQTYVIPPGIAVIHHFRSCPASWKDCHSRKRILDNSTLVFKTQLTFNVGAVLTKLGNPI